MQPPRSRWLTFPARPSGCAACFQFGAQERIALVGNLDVEAIQFDGAALAVDQRIEGAFLRLDCGFILARVDTADTASAFHRSDFIAQALFLKSTGIGWRSFIKRHSCAAASILLGLFPLSFCVLILTALPFLEFRQAGSIRVSLCIGRIEDIEETESGRKTFLSGFSLCYLLFQRRAGNAAINEASESISRVADVSRQKSPRAAKLGGGLVRTGKLVG